MNTFLTSDELAKRIKFNKRYINEKLKDHCLVEGTHYVRPFGGRKILYLWENIAHDIEHGLLDTSGIGPVPLTKGAVYHA